MIENEDEDGEFGPKVINLKNRLGVRREEIPELLPLSMREVEELISSDKSFPEGFPVRTNGRKKYDIAELRAWWEARKAAWRENSNRMKLA